MNFKILCRSFEARTKPYQIKQTELIKIGQEMTEKKQISTFWARTHTHTHTYGARFIERVSTERYKFEVMRGDASNTLHFSSLETHR